MILFVSHNASRTGAPVFLLRLLRWFRAHTDLEFRVLLREGGPLEPEFRALARTDLAATTTLDQAAFQDIELIYSNTCTNGELLQPLAQRGIPILTHVHELHSTIDSFGPKNLAAVLQQTVHYIACSQAVAANLQARYRIPSESISVHYEAIPVTEVRHLAQTSAGTRRSLGLAEDSFVIGACGQVDWRKGPDYFLHLAASLLRHGGLRQRLEFVWVGGMPYEPHAKVLQTALHRLKLDGSLRFVGEQENPYPWLNAFDLFCLPSREDPFPLVMLEAGALGKPVLCFAGSGGAVEFCERGGGYAVPYLDAEAMSRQCLALLQDPALLRQTGQTAARLASEMFDLPVVAPAILQTLTAVARSKPAASPLLSLPVSAPTLVERDANTALSPSDPVVANPSESRTPAAASSSSSEAEAHPAVLVSIVIPTFNKLELTWQCLEALRQQSSRAAYEIIIVDNGSNDGTAGFLRAEDAAGHLRAVLNPNNLGFAKACNQGAAAARGQYILFLNNDTEVQPGWLDPMCEVLQADPSVAAVGSKLLFPDGTLQHAGVLVAVHQVNSQVSPFHVFYRQPAALPAANRLMEYAVCTGACLLTRATHFRQVGGFDEEFWNGYEDVDLCLEFRRRGWRVVYQPASVVTHYESQSGPERFSKERRNVERLQLKWRGKLSPDVLIERNGKASLRPSSTVKPYRLPKPRRGAGSKPLAPTATNAPSDSPAVSIIIPVFNNLSLTRACLDSLACAASATACELVVVDNASSDGTPEFLHEQQQARRLRLISNPQNAGFARACNQGAQAARGSLLLFLNNDTRVLPGWLQPLVQAAERPDVGIVGAKLLYADNSIQHAGIAFINGIPDHPHRHAPADAPEANRSREFDMVTGACLLIQRELFFQLAGFDEAYRNGVEDIDLCLRARLAGKKVVYEPKAVVYHLEGQSAGRFDHVNDNLQFFFRRWAKAFDAQMRFRVPATPRLMPAERSALRQAGLPTIVSPLKVAWEGTFLDYGSLSHVNREMTGCLARLSQLSLTRVERTPLSNAARSHPQGQGLLSSLRPKAPADAQVTVRHAWPPQWQRPRSGKLVIIQPWEYGAVPVEWVQNSRQVDEFWVPSEYVRRVYVDSGVAEAKVRVVPNGVDPDRFHPSAAPLPLPTQKRFKFLFVGGTIHRKGPDVLLKAFLQAFSAADDVCLVIKDFGGQSCYAGQTMEQTIAAARQQPGAPEILHLTEELPPESLPGLYTACDCLAHPYRGEGFGLPVLEAMACGLPVIVTAGGAADDFASEERAFRIPGRRTALGQTISGMKLAGAGWLLEPDAEALAARMQWLVAHRDEARAKGRAASEYARHQWSWERAAQIAAERLQALAAPSPPRLTPHASPPQPIELPPCARVAHLGPARDLLARKKTREAWETTRAALQARPFHPEAYLLLAEIASLVGDGQSARLCAEYTRRLAPGWKPARQFLNRRLSGSNRPAWLALPEEARNPKLNAQPRLSVCLITKNEERFIRQCLQSIRGLAQQIVVVDTGSTDQTVALAQEHGAEVHHFAWCDDFSAARNAALEHATGDWVLVLDADEELSAEAQEKLRAHLNEAAVIGWRLPLGDVGREALGRSYVPRLFRNAPGLFYVGRVHEQVFTSLEVRRAEWGLESRLGEATLLHHGYTADVMQERNKVQRNLALLERAVEELPDEPHLLMNLGLELSRSGREAEALDRYRQAFEAMAARPASQLTPEGREMLLAQFCTRLSAARQFDEVVRALTSPLAKSGSGLNASLHFALGLAQMELGQSRPAAENMELCLARRNRPSLSPVNPDIASAAPYHCLALCHARLGNVAPAEKAFQDGLKQKGHLEKLRLDYAKFLAEQGRAVDALHRLHEAVTENAQDIPAWRLGGHIALSRPEFLEFARDWTHEASVHLPQDDVIAAHRAEALLLSQDTAAAKDLWDRLWTNDRRPAALAALILCELTQGAPTHAPQNVPETAAVTRAFLDWYRKCIAVGARELVVALNARTPELRRVLPEAAQILESVVTQTGQPQPAEACGV